MTWVRPTQPASIAGTLAAVRVTAIQLNAGTDIEANLATIERLVDDAVAASAPQLVVTPEYSAFLADQPDMPASAAHFQEVGAFMAELARRHAIVLHVGSSLEPASPRSFNTSTVYGPDGSLLATYRKIHLFDMEVPGAAVYRESDVLQRGEGIVTYDVAGVTVGCTICYDLRFPTLYRRLRDAGVQVIVVPSAFTLQTGMAHWHVLLRARAIETGCYVVAAAQWGTYGGGRVACVLRPQPGRRPVGRGDCGSVRWRPLDHGDHRHRSDRRGANEGARPPAPRLGLTED